VRRTGLLGLALLLLLSPVGLTAVVASSAPPAPPAQDPFYTYSGAEPLGTIPPGTVLKARSVRLAFGTKISTPLRAAQLLYRTTGQLGQPTVTVTTVLQPTPIPVVPRIIDYLSFYDGLGSRCDPSFTLAGGDPGGSINQQEAQEEELLILWYLSQGDIITVPDIEGTHLDWMAGHESGYAALDAVLATESFLKLSPATKVGMSGYSGGAVAADWASELAPGYAPNVNIVAVAEGGIPANYIDLFDYINGSAEYSAAIPGMLIGLSRAYGIDLASYLTPYGQKVISQEDQVCMASVFGHYQLTLQDIMLPAYRDVAHVAPFSRMLSDQTMGTAGTHPRAPLFMGIGNVDGRGDGAMSAVAARALARHYCLEGVPVNYQEYRGASHVTAGAFFDPETGPILQERFAGVPFVSNCSSLGS
jgi:hypothetical protein